MTLDMKHPKALGARREADRAERHRREQLHARRHGALRPRLRERAADEARHHLPQHVDEREQRARARLSRLRREHGVRSPVSSTSRRCPGASPRAPAPTTPTTCPIPCHAAFAVLAALRHRRRTGEGQFIDMAQTEPTIALLGPAVLDFTVNGRVHAAARQRPSGRRAARRVPLPGEDRWIAICVMTDAHWQALRQVLGDPGVDARRGLRPDGGTRGRVDRRSTRSSTRRRRRGPRKSSCPRCSRAACRRASCETAADVTRDPQLEHRGHWVKLEHPEMGESLYNAPPFPLLAHTGRALAPRAAAGRAHGRNLPRAAGPHRRRRSSALRAKAC